MPWFKRRISKEFLKKSVVQLDRPDPNLSKPYLRKAIVELDRPDPGKELLKPLKELESKISAYRAADEPVNLNNGKILSRAMEKRAKEDAKQRLKPEIFSKAKEVYPLAKKFDASRDRFQYLSRAEQEHAQGMAVQGIKMEMRKPLFPEKDNWSLWKPWTWTWFRQKQ